MCKAIEAAFPSAGRLSCSRHLPSNADAYLRDQIGVPEKERARLVKTVFGKEGLAEATDQVLFECRLQLVRDTLTEIGPNV